jgi:hypothetical protein
MRNLPIAPGSASFLSGLAEDERQEAAAGGQIYSPAAISVIFR